ncbi:MAG: MAPEG family protein [Pseudomonadota bacterium]
MTAHDLFFPALAQVGITFFLLIWMGRVRVRALAGEKVRVGQIALGQRAWPEHAQRVSNAFHNQLEMPILFYAALVFAIQFQLGTGWFVLLAWLFVASRLAHLFFQISGRNIRARFAAFCAGALALGLMWIMLGVHVVLTAPVGAG